MSVFDLSSENLEIVDIVGFCIKYHKFKPTPHLAKSRHFSNNYPIFVFMTETQFLVASTNSSQMC